MILLTDISFFTGPRYIPNLNEGDNVANNLQTFIRRHEPQVLNDVLGYSLYTGLQAALSASSTVPRWQNLLLGTEYTDQLGNLTYWKGLIETDASLLNFGSNAIGYKPVQWITVGVTTDGNGNVIIPANVTGFIYADWIGWQPIIQVELGTPLQPDIDYTYNSQTGTFAFINPQDSFRAGQRLFVQFEMQYTAPVAPSSFTYKMSLMADYIYFYWMRNAATSSSGLGEVVPQPGNATSVSSMHKQVAAWNDMSDRIFSLWQFLNTQASAYPEWNTSVPYRYAQQTIFGGGLFGNCPVRKYQKINTFNI